MVLFHDPLPCEDAAERAVGMAVEMRAAVAGLQAGWRRRGREIGFGVGIAQGYATLGQIGFAQRVDSAAIEGTVTLDEIGDLALKGLSQAVAVYNVVGAP